MASITTGPDMTLNQGQREAADAFYDFLFDDSAREFIISGPAGVGKTFMMSHIVRDVMPRYHRQCELLGIKPDYQDVDMTATTNKAAEVLSGSVGRQCKTVHSFFNLRVYDDEDTGETKLARTKDWKVHQNKVIFVDECSMIDTALWKMLNEGVARSKIVYVGDHCQMAPITEASSPIYNQGSRMCRLLEPVRNAGSPALMDLCAQFRRTVEEGVWAPLREVPGAVEVLDGNQMQEHLRTEFSDLAVSSRILAYTNDKVLQYLQYIREDVRGLPAHYVEGERLVVGSAYSKGSGEDAKRLNVEQLVTVSEEREHSDVLIQDGVFLRVGSLLLSTISGPMPVQYPLDRQHYRKLVAYYKRQGNWKMFFKLKNEFADLRPADACTVYKSQGSTYDSVYVDLADISACPNPAQAARMLYVAFSRARSRVYLYGELAPRFGGPVLRA